MIVSLRSRGGPQSPRNRREVPRDGTRTELAGLPTSRPVRLQLPFEPRLLPCPFRISVTGFAAPLQHRTAKADQSAPNSAQGCSRSAARFSSPLGLARPATATDATKL